MNVEKYCRRSIVAIRAQASVLEAAELMRARQTSFLVVFNEGDSARKPIGVVTDHDIVHQVTALQADAAAVLVGDIMTRRPLVAKAREDLGDFMQRMRMAGVRRAPVVDAHGRLLGIIAANEVLDAIAGLLDGASSQRVQ